MMQQPPAGTPAAKAEDLKRVPKNLVTCIILPVPAFGFHSGISTAVLMLCKRLHFSAAAFDNLPCSGPRPIFLVQSPAFS